MSPTSNTSPDIGRIRVHRPITGDLHVATLQPISSTVSRPGKVFDLVLPIAQVAEGYKAMDERRAIKTMLRVDQ